MTGLAFSLLGVNGETFDLMADPVMMAGSPQVFGVGPVEIGVRPSPALTAGSMRGSARRAEWPLVVPLRINGTQQVLLEQIELLAAATDPTRGDVTLRVVRPDGSEREMIGHYSGGLTPEIESCEVDSIRADLVLRCPHPFWRSTTPTSTAISFPVTGSGVTATPFSDDTVAFSDPGTPFNGWEATAEGGTVLVTLTNVGSAPAWPLWTINGTVTGVTASNLTTGRVWAWTEAPYSVLTASETVEVRTAEKSRVVRLTTGENRYRGLSVGARDLWPLAPGDNLVLLEVSGADSTTTASVEFDAEYLTC